MFSTISELVHYFYKLCIHSDYFLDFKLSVNFFINFLFSQTSRFHFKMYIVSFCAFFVCFVVSMMACPDNCQCNRDQTECYITLCSDEIDLSSQVIVIHGVLCDKQRNLLQKLSGDVLIILKNDICYGIPLCESEVRHVNCLENCRCNHYLNECFINSCDDDLELNIDTIVIHENCVTHTEIC